MWRSTLNEPKKYKVVRNCGFVFGESNKVWIMLNKGQVWELTKCPSDTYEWYRLSRENVDLEVTKEDFVSIFMPYENACKR